jgi:hypothetical protein
MTKQSVPTEAPSREDKITALKEQIELKEYQVKLQELNTKLAVFRADELEAFAKIAHYSKSAQPGQGDVVEHTVTEADLQNNPEMIEMGIKVGDRIGIPTAAYDAFLNKVDQTGQDLQKEYISEEAKAEATEKVEATERKLKVVKD